VLILRAASSPAHDADLSVPDWPTSYGWNMPTSAVHVGREQFLRAYRLLASSVGVLTIVLSVWLCTRGKCLWLCWLGAAGPLLSLSKRLLGGIIVPFHLAPAVSTAHAGLAEIFFSMTVAIALFTSPGWNADTP
jgi:heme a synthase